MSEVIQLSRAAPAVEVVDLRKEFVRRDKKAGRFARKRRAAVEGVTFTMERGECVAILGQNGSGKSTLIRVISTLLTADSGTVKVFGYDIHKDEMRVKQMEAASRAGQGAPSLASSVVSSTGGAQQQASLLPDDVVAKTASACRDPAFSPPQRRTGSPSISARSEPSA